MRYALPPGSFWSHQAHSVGWRYKMDLIATIRDTMTGIYDAITGAFGFCNTRITLRCTNGTFTFGRWDRSLLSQHETDHILAAMAEPHHRPISNCGGIGFKDLDVRPTQDQVYAVIADIAGGSNVESVPRGHGIGFGQGPSTGSS